MLHVVIFCVLWWMRTTVAGYYAFAYCGGYALLWCVIIMLAGLVLFAYCRNTHYWVVCLMWWFFCFPQSINDKHYCAMLGGVIMLDVL